MRSPFKAPLALLCALLSILPFASAVNELLSTSLNSCQEGSQFQASLFDFHFWPENGTVRIHIISVSSVSGHAEFDITLYAFGYAVKTEVVDPCEANMKGLCPMAPAPLDLPTDFHIPPEQLAIVPGIAYTFPDIDAKVQVLIKMKDGNQKGQTVACLEAQISNGKTVDTNGVKWATAIIAVLALTSSGILSGLGYYNAASHVAVNALSLFSYFQAQALVGLCAIKYPPLVQAWTQDFQWTIGIINVDFMQSIFRWFLKATGGSPENLMHFVGHLSVQVAKRAVSGLEQTGLIKRGGLDKRGNIELGSGSYIVYGIQRVAYKAHIESTNLFMTGITFFFVLLLLTIILVGAFKGFCTIAVKNKWMKHDRFLDFRNGWRVILKGILFRMLLIAYPAVTVLSLWEFTQRDSGAEVALAVFFLIGLSAGLGWGAFKVIAIARRSIQLHQNPAYILFSDPRVLNKWGFLYVQFRASAYYFIVPLLAYALLKSIIVGLLQSSKTAQAVAFIIIEAGCLIGVCIMRPWMDKSTNSFNIAISAVNFINSILMLLMTDIFNAPPLLIGIVGVLFWLLNAIFALVLLIMLIVTTAMTFWRTNPDARYQQMADDRVSFMKSQTHLNTNMELDALGVTARGGPGGGGLDLDEDNESISSDSLRRQVERKDMPLPSSKGSMFRDGPPRSPIEPSVPFIPSESRSQSPRPMKGMHPSGYSGLPRSASPFRPPPSPGFAPQSPGFRPYSPGLGPPSPGLAPGSPSPWKRGAGYDH